MRVILLASTALVLLTACSKPAGSDDAAPMAEAAAAPVSKSAAAADATAGSEAAARPAVTIPRLAYSYAYGLEAPARSIRDLVARHEAACQAAGPAVCQLTGAQVSEVGKDRIHGQLSLRATAGWLKVFREGLDAQAKAAGGRIVTANVTSEDLSRQIVDTEAAIRARITLRDRLQTLLANRPGKLADLLEVERELAQVQGEIDATQSQLAEMRGRVATSELRLTYESIGVLAPQGVLAPLKAAVGDVAGIVVMVLAGLLRLAAYLLPIGALAGLAFWLVRGRRTGRAKAPAA